MLEPAREIAVEGAPVIVKPIDKRTGPGWRALAFLGPDFTFFLAFLALFFVLSIIYGAHFHIWGEGSILIAAGIAAGLLAVRFLWRAPAIVLGKPGARGDFLLASQRILRDWGPMILLTVVFENLHAYTGRIRHVPIDAYLYKLDVFLFGIEPTVWIGRFAHPLVTDYFAFAYGLYFILPMILATSLAARGRRHDFRELMTGVVLHMCIGFLCFIVFPAGPPRFYRPLLDGSAGAHFSPPQLTSYFGLFEMSQGAFDTSNPVSDHSSFPSMHCAVAMLTLCYAWRFGSCVFPKHPRRFFWIMLPFIVSLWVSTVYLRHHWVPDCLAGMALGYSVYKITPALRRWWPGAERALAS